MPCSGDVPEHWFKRDALHAIRERAISLGMNAGVTATLSALVLGSATPYPAPSGLWQCTLFAHDLRAGAECTSAAACGDPRESARAPNPRRGHARERIGQ